MKVLIAAGGTGGHIYPGIAIAKELAKRDPDAEVMFVGTARGLEKTIVPDNGFQLALIHSVGLKNVGIVGKIKGATILPRSLLEAWRLIRDFNPDVVVGAGGYVSGPVVMTAALMGRPTLVMDSNALPGFTNRQLARFVDKAALSFEAALPYFGKKGVVTGNPVRCEFFEIVERRPRQPFEILIFGGSQGARAINNAMIEALPELADMKESIRIVHQTGQSDYDSIAASYSDAGWENVEVRPYIVNMVESFDTADLIICRAGATTCAEVAAAGKPALLIPFPGAADDHQRKNAEALVTKGAAKMIVQSDLTGPSLAVEVKAMLDDVDALMTIGRVARSMARPDAVGATADLIEGLKRK
jgi:UDP-N-acetylglucosamine--N-acetylmuramyl-(pentapeptide) pyrophosphoryl-undecaprenol N-acetylglucosamine transferase